MKIQNRLSLYSTIVFAVIFALTAFLIYSIYTTNIIRFLNENLKNTAYITAIFYLEEDELNGEEFAKVRAQFNEIVNNSYYQIYDEKDSISYGSSHSLIDPQILNEIRLRNSLAFSNEEFYCYGIFYEDNQGDFVVISREKKDGIKHQRNILLWILLAVFFVGTMAIIILNKWISSIAYKPFREAIKQVKEMSAGNLENRLIILQTEDELQDLMETFNELLEKISETVIIQKNFVRYVSHEFKTPLMAIMGNLEVFSLKDRTPEEYKEMSGKIIQQVSQLEEILNTLIIISDLRNQTNVASSSMRIDEVIWEIISKISVVYPKSKISVNMEVKPEDEEILFIDFERTQFLIALYNLIENAVKFSNDQQVEISITNHNNHLQISITDHGIGIPPEDLKNICKPFYRAENTSKISGSGIGLSIALRILEKNSILYYIDSVENKGTTIVIYFNPI